MIICNSNCWFCYAKNVPRNVLLSMHLDAENNFDKFLWSNVQGAFCNEVELTIVRLGDRIFGDITDVPIEKLMNLAKRIQDLGYEVYCTTSHVSEKSVKFFEKLALINVSVRKLTVHCLDKYYESRGVKDLGISVLKSNLVKLLNLSKSFGKCTIMQVVFPKYFGWKSIVDTSEYFLDEVNIDSICWHVPYMNRWSKGVKVLYDVDNEVNKWSEYLELRYGLNRFRSIDIVEKCSWFSLKNRFDKLNEKYVIYTSFKMKKILKDIFHLKNTVISVENKFLGGTIASAGLLTLYDLRSAEGFYTNKYVTLPKEFGYIGNNVYDLVGNKLDRDILFV